MEAANHFRLSLRISHPSIEPDAISTRLGLNPTRQWAAGAARTTSAGRPLDGVRDSTYWSCEMATGPGGELLDAIRSATAELGGHGEFIRALRSGGGMVEYFVGWFPDASTSGIVLPHDLLRAIGAIGVDLAFDLYGPAV